MRNKSTEVNLVKHLTLCGDVLVVNPPKQKFECPGLHISRFGSGAPSVLQELRMIIRIVHGRRMFGNPCLFQRSTGIISFLATPTNTTTQSCRLDETRMTVAHVLPVRGADMEWVTEQAARDLLCFGMHGHEILKSDQEPAIVDVLKETAKLRGRRRTILEASQVGDSKSNGVAEMRPGSTRSSPLITLCLRG